MIKSLILVLLFSAFVATMLSCRFYFDTTKDQFDASSHSQSLERGTNLAFNIETIKRLASVVYFDETENLMLFDSEYGQKKVKEWEMHDFIGFFLQTPIKELLQLEGISETSLRNFMESQSQVLRDLTLNPSTLSAANT